MLSANFSVHIYSHSPTLFHRFKMDFNENALIFDFEAIATVNNAHINTVVEMLTDSGLRKFLGCGQGYSAEIVSEFFANASVRNGIVISTIKGKACNISQHHFADALELPTSGIDLLTAVPNGNMDIWASQMTISSAPMIQHGEKKDLKMEFRWIANIVAKSILAKAGAYEKITLEKLHTMVLIASRITVNWSEILFHIFSEMVRGRNQSQRFAVQIFYLLGLSKMVITSDDLLPSKLVNAATVGSFIKRNTPTPEELTQVKIELGVAQEKKKRAPAASKRKYTVVSSSSEADSTAPLISVFSKPQPQRKMSKKTMALVDVVLPAPNQAKPDQSEVESTVVEQQAPLLKLQVTQAPPNSSVTIAAAASLKAQPVLPRKPRTQPVERIKLSTASFFEPPPTAPRKGVIIQEPVFVSPFAPKPATYESKGKNPMEDRPKHLSPAMSHITLLVIEI